MLGFRLLFLGFKTLLRNVLQIIAVGVLPGLLAYAMYLFVDLQVDRIIQPNMRFIVSIPVFMLALAVPTAWAGINWQRVTYLKEKPAVLPFLRGGIFARFAWQLMLLIAGAIGVSYGVFFVMDFIITSFIVGSRNELLLGVFVIVSLLIYYLLLTYPFMRLGLCLPGTSVGSKTTLVESWRMTKGYSGTIITISLSLMFIMGGLTIGVLALGWLEEEIGLGLFLSFFVLLWLTMLTELYGYIRAQNDVEQVFG